ncbi:MAG: hypothetical protein O7A71_06060 [Chloroflexi bacterium]|nr:hypothetical protein [Chloroflexota bacterium]
MARRRRWKTPLAAVLVSAAIVVAALSSVLYAQASQGEAETAGIAICHAPTGNPANAHTIVVGEDALAEHEAHGDLEGECVQPRLTGHGRAAVGEGGHPGLGRGAAKPPRGIHARLAAGEVPDGKLVLCHKGRTQLVSDEARADHLAHRDQIGECR